MSPVHDPRFSKVRWGELHRQESDAGERQNRLEYVKPLVLLAACLPLAVIQVLLDAGGAVAALAGYGLSFGASFILAMAALLLAVRLLVGDAGPMGLSALRVAAAAAGSDVIYLLLAPGPGLYVVPGVAATLAFVGLVMWLFDMDAGEGALIGIIVCCFRMGIAAILHRPWT